MNRMPRRTRNEYLRKRTLSVYSLFYYCVIFFFFLPSSRNVVAIVTRSPITGRKGNKRFMEKQSETKDNDRLLYFAEPEA